jgi:hypothetical protein
VTSSIFDTRGVGGLRATGSPSDFPTAEQLRNAIAIDELAREVNRDHDEWVAGYIDSVLRRIDRIVITDQLMRLATVPVNDGDVTDCEVWT